MIRSVTLDNYRGFRQFELHDLGRVNLIVGTNNAGKTSVLEAVNLLASSGDPTSLWSTLWRRGEDFEEREVGATSRHVDIKRLFNGHNAGVGCRFSLTAETDGGRASLTAEVEEPRRPQPVTQATLFEPFDNAVEPDYPFRPSVLALRWQGQEDISVHLDLTRRGGVSAESIRWPPRGREEVRRPTVRLITAAALSPELVIELFEETVLTPDEDMVYEALRIIEPSIERLATSGTDRRRTGTSSRPGVRGGLLVRCNGIKDRIPIGSMGDGIWRLLGLALALVRTEGGILLVDEIDTGLHYSVMENMWKLVHQTARRLRIQLFATTHSRDCYESLAAISRDTVSKNSEITIQRIERGKERSVAYSEQEIIAAARRHTEVR
jgi:energy-coupling factor transporter ATP-binding protein EcfA2